MLYLGPPRILLFCPSKWLFKPHIFMIFIKKSLHLRYFVPQPTWRPTLAYACASPTLYFDTPFSFTLLLILGWLKRFEEVYVRLVTDFINSTHSEHSRTYVLYLQFLWIKGLCYMHRKARLKSTLWQGAAQGLKINIFTFETKVSFV